MLKRKLKKVKGGPNKPENRQNTVFNWLISVVFTHNMKKVMWNNKAFNNGYLRIIRKDMVMKLCFFFNILVQ